MRLLLLNYEYPPIGGGGGFGCEKLVQALSRHVRYEVTVLTAGIGNTTTTDNDEFGVNVIRVPCAKHREHRSSASFVFMLTYILRAVFFVWKNRREWRKKFDVISTQFAIPTGPAGYIIAKILRLPNVLTLHGGELFSQPLELMGYGFAINSVVRFIINHCAAVHANSHDTKKAAKRFLGITRPIHVISTGFSPPEDFSLREHDFNQRPVRFVMVSRLVARKGLIYLLEALAQIEKSRWLLTLVGDGPEEAALKTLATERGILDCLSFTGFVSEARKFAHLNESDVFVLPTLHEGLGLVYYEAMYAALPIITTNNGGQTDFLTPEENALLVPIRDIPTLKMALERAIADADWRHQCGKANRQKVLSLLVIKLVPEYDALFRSVARRGHS